MNYDEIKEKLINSGYGFCEANGGILATTKSNIMDTSIITFIDFSNFYKSKIFKVNYKCAKTGKTRSIHYLYLKDFMDDYGNFLEFLGAIESAEKEYSYVSSIVKDICIK